MAPASGQPDAVKRLPEHSTSSSLAEAAAILGLVLLVVNVFAGHDHLGDLGLGLMLLAVFLKLPVKTEHKNPDPPRRPNRPV